MNISVPSFPPLQLKLSPLKWGEKVSRNVLYWWGHAGAGGGVSCQVTLLIPSLLGGEGK